jgi:HEAT repeat protein
MFRLCSCLLPLLAFAQTVSLGQLQTWIAANNVGAIRALGQGVMPALVQLYENGDANVKANVARTFYTLSWKSPEAKRILMKDVHTPDANLRLQVQWALGRVSNDADVVDVLLANMRTDGNPLFRDKAACALAYDQIHLTERQKVRLFEALIESLRDEKQDVRSIALQALSIHTGQTKGYDPNAPLYEREQRIRVWKRWLDEYKSGL